MGSDAHVIVVGGPDGLVEQAVRRIDELERRWSRFLDDSEISSLNRHAGTFVAVSPDTVLLVERAVAAWRLSAGACDPTVLGAVLQAGYDRTFDLLGADHHDAGRAVRGGAGDFRLAARVDDITVDRGRVRIPVGTGFDPGGIGKGLAAGLVTAELMAAGADGSSVNLGGDLQVRGGGPGGGPWTVAIEHPWSNQAVALVGLTDGAVATSTTLRRRWQVNGTIQHHLIDPQTGLPSDTDVTLATVIAAHAWVAEAQAKACLLAGWANAFDTIGGTGSQALVVDDGGRVKATPGFDDFLGAATLAPTVIGRGEAAGCNRRRGQCG